MKRIAIVSSSIRRGRNSHRIALWFRRYITVNAIAEIDFIDLAEYNFPLFTERLVNLDTPPPGAVTVASLISEADGVIIVTPEYNGGYPASLKNMIDLLTSEWRRKPVAIATSSDGPFGGTQVITSLLFTFWKLGALIVPARFQVPETQNLFSDDGTPADEKGMTRRTSRFIDALLRMTTTREGEGS